jgi:DNA-binding NarL/FixJ family response regulator
MPEDSGASALLLRTMHRMAQSRGRLNQLRRMVKDTLIPAVTVDNERRYLEANKATQLLFRMTNRELQQRQIEDLTSPDYLSVLGHAWRRLMEDGLATGPYVTRFLDGSRLRVVYRAVSNVLPGQHLIVFVPADWPEDELAELDERASAEPVAGPLTAREREVLTLVAAGAHVEQIALGLTITPATVKSHIRNIHRKLGSRNRAHAVALALQLGLIDPCPRR